MRVPLVPELDDKWLTLQRGLGRATLDATATAMDESDGGEPSAVCLTDVVVDDCRDVSWRERVEVELRLDWQRLGVGILWTPVVRHVRGFSLSGCRR